MAKKHLLQIKKAVQALAPDISVEHYQNSGHIFLTVEYQGRRRRFSVSSTPTNHDFTVRNAVKEIARFFNLEPSIKC